MSHPADIAASKSGIIPGAIVEWRREVYRKAYHLRPIDTGVVLEVKDGYAQVVRDNGDIVYGPWACFSIIS